MRKTLRDRTKNFALRVIRMYASLPRNGEAMVLGRQVLRSGTSIGANYREAFRARSRAEFVAKMGDCLREIEETGYWFELLDDAGIVGPTTLSELRQECNELTAIFVPILKNTKAQRDSSPPLNS